MYEQRTAQTKNVLYSHVFNHFCGSRNTERSALMKKILRKSMNLNLEDGNCNLGEDLPNVEVIAKSV